MGNQGMLRRLFLGIIVTRNNIHVLHGWFDALHTSEIHHLLLLMQDLGVDRRAHSVPAQAKRPSVDSLRQDSDKVRLHLEAGDQSSVRYVTILI